MEPRGPTMKPLERKALRRKTPLKLAIGALIVFGAAACTTTRGSFCQIAEPIRPANVDVLTDAEVSQILALNEKGRKLCGWRQ
jgi:hypothetical protein